MAKIRRKIKVYKTRIKVSIRDFGLGHALFRIVTDSLLSKVFQLRKYIIYVKQLSPVEPPKLRNPDFEFSFMSPDDKNTPDQIEELSGLSREFIVGKIKNGAACVLAKSNGTLAGFNLVSFGFAHVRYLNAYFPLSESDGWSEQITVSPENRRGGLASDLRALMFSHLAKNGYTRLIGGYVPFNVKSGLLAKKLGFVETEKITELKILGWRKFYRQNLLSSSPGLPSTNRLDTPIYSWDFTKH